MRPDLDQGRRFVRDLRPPPGRVVLCAVTGAHLYGFPSADSDLDLKGLHLAPTASFLGLGRVPEVHDVTETVDGVECDLTTNELGVALVGLLKGNGNYVERIASPLQLFETPIVEALRGLLPGLLSTRVYGHYAGYFDQTCRFFDREPRAKTLLYTARVALTGIHLLRTGEAEAHLPTLAAEHGIEGVDEVIALKRELGEKAVLSPETAAPLRRQWPALREALDRARDESALPMAPTGRDEAEAWLIDLRSQELR